MEFKTIDEFVTSKFSEGTTPLTLITSLNTGDTIGGINAALVLADRENQQKPLSELIGKKLNRDVYIQSNSNGIYASVAILCYEKRPRLKKKTKGKNYSTVEEFLNAKFPGGIPSLVLLTSNTTIETIKNVNAVIYIARMEKVADVLSKSFDENFYVRSEVNENFASVTILRLKRGYNFLMSGKDY